MFYAWYYDNIPFWELTKKKKRYEENDSKRAIRFAFVVQEKKIEAFGKFIVLN